MSYNQKNPDGDYSPAPKALALSLETQARANQITEAPGLVEIFLKMELLHLLQVCHLLGLPFLLSTPWLPSF